MRYHTISFKHAVDGIIYSLRTQPNFRIHLFFTVMAVMVGYFLQLLRWEWVALWLAIFMVIVTEMLNTAIESMTDLLTSEHRLAAKIAKDTAAGMVLITAVGSIVIGIFIFVPHLFQFMN